MTEPDMARSLFSAKGEGTAARRRKRPASEDPTSSVPQESESGGDPSQEIADLRAALDAAVPPDVHAQVQAELDAAHKKVDELIYRLELSQKSEKKLKEDIQTLTSERDQLLQKLLQPEEPPKAAPLASRNVRSVIQRPVFAHPKDDDQDMPSYMLD